MQSGQERIYFLIAESIEAARASPYIERLKARGIEVLLLADRIDEWIMGQVEAFEGKRFKDAARGDLELGALASEADKHDADAALKESKGLLKRVKDALGERVLEVRVSTRLTDSPSCLVLGEHELRTTMRRLLAAAGQKAPDAKPMLELNVAHPIVKYLDAEKDSAQFAQLAELLYDQAALAEGGQLANPAEYVQRLNRLLIRLAGVHEAASHHERHQDGQRRCDQSRADGGGALHGLALCRGARATTRARNSTARAIAIEPFRFRFGAGEVIKGWDQGVAGMAVGGSGGSSFRRRSATASGARAAAIPPGATLVFDVELLGIE